MGGVAALELPDPLELDAAGVLEEAAAGAKQDRDQVDLQLVELTRAEQRLGGARAVHHDRTVARCGPGVRGAGRDVGVERRSGRCLVVVEWRVSTLIGTPSWWSPPHPPARS